MMKNIVYTLLIVSLAFTYACEKTEKIDDFPLYPPKLVLNSFINPDSSISIHLSKSLSVLDNADLKDIDNGEIKLYENGNLIATTNTSLGNGVYIFNDIPKSASIYKVEANAPSLEAVKASTLVPNPVAIKKIDVQKMETSDYYEPHKFTVSFDDPANESNYYMLRIRSYNIDTAMYMNDTFYYEHGPNRVYISSSTNPAIDDITNGNAFFTDEFFNGKSYTMDVTADYLDLYSYKVKLVVELYCLSEESYKYRKSFGIYQESRDNPFAEPVLVFNNIEGGYGIFGGEIIRSDSAVIEGNGSYYWKN